MFPTPTELRTDKYFKIIRMIADHEKEEDEINTLVDDWIFFALVIDRILLVFFGIVCLLGSFGLFYR